jgi:hypothetical protein
MVRNASLDVIIQFGMQYMAERRLWKDGWALDGSDDGHRVNRVLQASAELAATYAALILADDGIEITVRRASYRAQGGLSDTLLPG